MTVEDCRVELNEDKHEVLKIYRNGVESSLAKADLLKSPDMTVLQAFVIYIACSRSYDKGPDIRKFLGNAIGIALKIGLHRDASASGLPPFQVEMRRRLWWQIYTLDSNIAEDCGTHPRILESWFDTELPLNVSDASLDPDMEDPPQNCSGKTEMVLALTRSEISNFARRTVFSDQFCDENCYPVLSASQKFTAVDVFKQKIERQYLSHLDQSIALDYFTTVSSNLILAKLKLAVIKPRARQDQSMLTHVNLRKVCTEILQKTAALGRHEKIRQWLWSFQGDIEWDALTCLLINLSLAPEGEVLDSAWQAVNETYDYLKMDGDCRLDHRWENIEELRTKALFSRDMIQINPSQWGASPDDDSGFEESHTMATESPQQLDLGILKRQREDDIGYSRSSLGELEPGAPNCRSEVSTMQSETQEHLPRMWALANAAAAAPAAINRSSHMEPASEHTDIPSSGTGCQWSETLFERYFQVLGSEQTTSL
ncbi:Transcription factor [Penicillium cf. griseofulvum]|nr:Transcription factor [Penicillium cf. griseofulvum]